MNTHPETRPHHRFALKGIKLVGITGKAGSGKSSLAEELGAEGFRRYSFASPLKNMLAQLPYLEHIFSMAALEKELVIPLYGKSPRKMMQTLGTEWGRHLVHPDIWVLIMEALLQNKIDMQISSKFAIDDLRYPNEAEWIRNNGGLIVHIQRSVDIEVAPHSSEAGLDIRVGEDLIVSNTGLKDRLRDAATIISTTIEERVKALQTVS